MPEGPEVRVIADKLRPKFVNEAIEKITLSEQSKVFNYHLAKLPAKIIEIKTRGKKLLIKTDQGYTIVFSLGMTGAFRYKKETHSHVSFFFDEKLADNQFHFTDTRRFGNVTFVEDNLLENHLSDLGPDLLEAALKTEDEWISSEEWLAIFARRHSRGLAIGKKAICVILLDQSFVAGIGNYLKSEILYFAGIHPERLASSLTEGEWENLRTKAHQVIRKSYRFNGLTIESYIAPDGTPGSYPRAVYNRKIDVRGNTISDGKTSDNRHSYWVELYQELF